VHSRVYYFNRSTGQSSYAEPPEHFRPLVRDLYSDALVQAWPQIENPGAYLAVETSLSDAFICGVCRNRPSVRVCLECEATLPTGQTVNLSYCFPCYSFAHINEKEGHRFRDADTPPGEFLTCSECELPATRKCQGFISEKRLERLCNELKKSGPTEWDSVLRAAGILDENKLRLLLNAVSESANGSVVVQWQQLKSLLERSRAECDENYCLDCYRSIHSGGKRSNHVWIGFREYAVVCLVCSHAPAEVRCIECAEDSCTLCFKILHAMGRKRRHKSSLLIEENPFNAVMCGECLRRVGTLPCPSSCGFIGCNSCCECVHIPSCPRLLRSPEDRYSCVLCREPADSTCIECGDLCTSL
jgi:hypothetical protein